MEHRLRQPAWLADAAKILLFATFCLALARLGMLFALDTSKISLVWPLTGLTLAAVYLRGRKYALGLWLAHFINSMLIGMNFPLAAACAAGSAGLALVGASLLHRADFNPALGRVRDVLSFFALGVVISPLVSALIGTTSFFFSGLLHQQTYAFHLFTWWVGDAMGVLIVAPVLFVWAKIPFEKPRQQRVLEGAVLVLLLGITASLVFGGGIGGRSFYPLAYLVFPFFVWAALRFDQRFIVTLMLFTATIAVIQTSREYGSFSQTMVWNSVLFLWAYITTMAITSMLLGATLTERRGAERKLRASEARYRAIIEDQTEMISRFDANWRLTFVNDAFCKYHRVQREQVLGTVFRAEIHPDDFERIQALVRGLSAENPVMTAEYRVLLPQLALEGISRWHQWTHRAITNDRGQVVEYQFVGKDITALKEAETQQLEVALEHERVQLLSDFITAASHDFRTPLSVINMSSYLLSRTDKEPRREHYLTQIHQQTHHMEHMIDGLMTMVRLDRGDVFKFKASNLNSAIQQIALRRQPQLEVKSLVLALELDASLPPVEVDVQWLDTAVTQVLDNAIYFTPDGGSITIRTCAEHECAIIAITDTGIGIRPEDMPHIFKRLFRGEDHRPMGGQGLGLSMVERIMEAHGGSVSVESQHGFGSTFRLSFPLAQATPNATRTRLTQPEPTPPSEMSEAPSPAP